MTGGREAGQLWKKCSQRVKLVTTKFKCAEYSKLESQGFHFRPDVRRNISLHEIIFLSMKIIFSIY